MENNGLVHRVRTQASREFFVMRVEVVLAVPKHTLSEKDDGGGEANLKLNRKEACAVKCPLACFEQMWSLKIIRSKRNCS